MFEIPFKAIEQLKDWNEPLHRNSLKVDECFVLVILLNLVEEKDIAEGNISDEVRDFIRGMTNI